MENKIIVQLYIAALSKSYDVYISDCAYIYEFLQMINKIIPELADDCYKSDNSSVLCNIDSGDIYNINKKISELKINNGSQLLLI